MGILFAINFVYIIIFIIILPTSTKNEFINFLPTAFAILLFGNSTWFIIKVLLIDKDDISEFYKYIPLILSYCFHIDLLVISVILYYSIYNALLLFEKIKSTINPPGEVS